RTRPGVAATERRAPPSSGKQAADPGFLLACSLKRKKGAILPGSRPPRGQRSGYLPNPPGPPSRRKNRSNPAWLKGEKGGQSPFRSPQEHAMKTKAIAIVATLALVLPAFALVLESTEAHATDADQPTLAAQYAQELAAQAKLAAAHDVVLG